MTIEKLTSLEGFVPDGQTLLASCFDAHHTIGGGLFAINGSAEELDRVSSTGLYASDGLLYRCLWSAEGSPAEIVAYDTAGVRRYHRLDDVSTPHDILVVDGKLLVVATTQNEVQCVGPDGEIAWRWRAPGEVDSWHLNSLAVAGDQIMVCGFGPFLRRRGWDESGKPATGQVVDLETGEPVLTGLRAPHNPCYSDGSWLVCDSAAGDLVEISGETRKETRRLGLPGWPRGLAMTDEYLFVGVSPHRHLTSSVMTAAVAVVDRAQWRVVGLVDLPTREVYALVLAPTALADGARQGFDANHTRVHEQVQRQLFDRLGRRPKRLWAIGDRLAEEECRAVVTLPDPAGDPVETGSLMTVDCHVRNTGDALLTPAPPYPVQVLHRWYDADGQVVDTQPIAAALPRSLPPEDVARVLIRARTPDEPGEYRLRVTLAQEGGAPFDEVDPAAAAEVRVNVVADGRSYEALTAFGLYPSEVRAARVAGGTVHDMIRALLTRTSGAVNGLTVGLIEEAGRPAFVSALAEVLGASEPALEHAVDKALPDPADVLLTGAEAVGLALRRSGVGVTFAYAGTSELVMCDAMARLGLLVNGRGDREALFQAGGASRLRPGRGAAILHGARGLTNALGALADLRRNEIGTVAVVGLPSTGSQPFLPPHGEPDLIPVSGAFAKSWHELRAVPAEADDREAAVETLVTALREAVRDSRQAPYGPVLVAVPQDVAEAAWVPLPALAGLVRAGVETPGDDDALIRAAALLAEARRPVVLIDDYALPYEGARAALAEFSERAGAPVLQVKYRRGPMLFERLSGDDVPGFLGWYDPADPLHRTVLEEADLLVTVEDRNMYPRVIGELPACRKIALTSKPAAARKNGYLGPDDVLVDADVVSSLRVLAGAARGRDGDALWSAGIEAGERPEGPRVPEEASKVRNGIARALGAVAAREPGQVVLVDDSQMFGGMLAEEYDEFPPGLRVAGGHGGFVGCGITLATGLALGEPGARVLCCLGDQGFTNSMQGLVSAVQEAAPVTFLVCNNGGSVSLRKQSGPSGWLDAGHDRYLDNAAGMDYVQIADALGVRSRRVDLSGWLDRDLVATRLETFARTLESMLAHPGPTLIELVLPSDPDFWTGVWINQGFEQQRAKESVKAGGRDA
jgi:acetolactate synthase-1/2/3 large subunit